MEIPDTPELEKFLEACKLTQTQPAGPAILIYPRVETLSPRPMPRIWLEHPDEGMTLNSAVRIFERALAKKGYAANSEIARIVLVLVLASRDPAEPIISTARAALAEGADAHLTQIVVLDRTIDAVDYAIHLDDFEIKDFEPSRLLYWANRGGSQYPFDISQLTGHVSIERRRFTTKVIPWINLKEFFSRLERRWSHEIASAALVDEYFQAVFQYHRDEIPGRLQRAMMVLEAGSLYAMNERSLLSEMFSQTIGLFSWRFSGKPKTWAVMSSRNAVRMNWAPAEIFRTCNDWLLNELRFKSFSSDKPLDRAIESYCEFLQRAFRHNETGAWDEAFLHFVIALDLLFGLETNITQNVAERAALLVHRQLAQSFADQEKAIRRLYQKRSKFVHEGISISESDLEQAEEVTREVLWTLLAVSGADHYRDLSDLLKQIDYLVSAVRADKSVSENEYVSVGVPGTGHSRMPPNRIDHRAARRISRDF